MNHIDRKTFPVLLAGRIVGWVMMGGFALGGVYVGSIYGGTLSVGGYDIPRVKVWQILYGVGFVGYVLLLYTFHRKPISTRSIIIAAVVLRGILLFCPPNNDCNRYIWEGRIQRLGFNPYRYAPNDPALQPYRDAIWQGINKKHYSTIYPPLAELEFRLLSMIHYDIKTPQVAHALLDIGVVITLAFLIAAMGQPAWTLAIYALCPLVLASFAHAGHNDPLMILGVLAFIAAALRKHWIWAGLALGLAILAKTTPAILLAVLLRRSRMAMVIAVATVALGYLLYIDAGYRVVFALLDFPGQTHFNNPFDEVRIWINQFFGQMLLARGRFHLVLALLAIAAAYRAWRTRDLVMDVRWLLTIVLLVLPIIHFWYVSWVLVLITLRPRGYWSWSLLTGTMVFYWFADFSWQSGGRWKLPPSTVFMIWVPFYLAWLAETIYEHRSKCRDPSTKRDADRSM